MPSSDPFFAHFSGSRAQLWGAVVRSIKTSFPAEGRRHAVGGLLECRQRRGQAGASRVPAARRRQLSGTGGVNGTRRRVHKTPTTGTTLMTNNNANRQVRTKSLSKDLQSLPCRRGPLKFVMHLTMELEARGYAKDQVASIP